MLSAEVNWVGNVTAEDMADIIWIQEDGGNNLSATNILNPIFISTEEGEYKFIVETFTELNQREKQTVIVKVIGHTPVIADIIFGGNTDVDIDSTNEYEILVREENSPDFRLAKAEDNIKCKTFGKTLPN